MLTALLFTLRPVIADLAALRPQQQRAGAILVFGSPLYVPLGDEYLRVSTADMAASAAKDPVLRPFDGATAESRQAPIPPSHASIVRGSPAPVRDGD